MKSASSTRKPPEPAKSHDKIDEWMSRQMPDLQPIVRRLDKLIRQAIPDLHYAVKWQKAYYGTRDLGWVIEVVSYDVSVNIVFLGGADFDDPPADGTDRSRYRKLRSLEEVDEPAIVEWIEQAVQVRGWQ